MQQVTDITGRWVVVSIDDAPTIEGRSPTLHVYDNRSSVDGDVACNSYVGQLSWHEDKVVLSDILVTTVTCQIPGIDMERYYQESNAFTAVIWWGPFTPRVTQNGELLLRGRGGHTVRLRRE